MNFLKFEYHERTYARYIERKNRPIVEANKRLDEIAEGKRGGGGEKEEGTRVS
jgi:hypothetical protein